MGTPSCWTQRPWRGTKSDDTFHCFGFMFGIILDSCLDLCFEYFWIDLWIYVLDLCSDY